MEDEKTLDFARRKDSKSGGKAFVDVAITRPGST